MLLPQYTHIFRNQSSTIISRNPSEAFVFRQASRISRRQFDYFGCQPSARSRRRSHRSRLSTRCPLSSGGWTSPPGKENHPKSGLANTNHTANLSGVILGYIEDDFAKKIQILNFQQQLFFKIHKICELSLLKFFTDLSKFCRSLRNFATCPWIFSIDCICSSVLLRNMLSFKTVICRQDVHRICRNIIVRNFR